MKILIIVAMEKELSLVLPHLENIGFVDNGTYTYNTGVLGGHDVAVAKCGIGKVNAAISTYRLINEEWPDLIINTGVAGGADKDIHPMDVVIADEVAYHDVWCGPGTEYGAADGFPARMETSRKVVEAAMKANPKAVKGLICSGDIFIDSPEQIEDICEVYPDALAVDMESAAVMQTAASQGIPCAVIRVISDSPVAGDNFAEYENFWEEAPQATFSALISTLKALPA